MSFLSYIGKYNLLFFKFLQTAELLTVSGHPWIKNSHNIEVPLDILIFKLMKAYMRSSALRKAALRVCMMLP